MIWILAVRKEFFIKWKTYFILSAVAGLRVTGLPGTAACPGFWHPANKGALYAIAAAIISLSLSEATCRKEDGKCPSQQSAPMNKTSHLEALRLERVREKEQCVLTGKGCWKLHSAAPSPKQSLCFIGVQAICLSSEGKCYPLHFKDSCSLFYSHRWGLISHRGMVAAAKDAKLFV